MKLTRLQNKTNMRNLQKLSSSSIYSVRSIVFLYNLRRSLYFTLQSINRMNPCSGSLFGCPLIIQKETPDSYKTYGILEK